VNDLYQIIPTNPELFTLELDGRSLLEVLENNLEQTYAANPFQQKGGYVLRSSNIGMAYKPYNPKGNRIQHIEIKGEVLQQDKLYRVVSAGQQMLKPYASEHKPMGVRAHDVLSEYFSASSIVKVDDRPCIITI
jgi:sulfur-oxidizing protein SoxB